ncbi:MAG TPA: 50S ribosomal protein L35 [Chthonomonadaceae bacterium]|nr:50S ribosomal protein L35 [Chthonomonadaceae bacterium]
MKNKVKTRKTVAKRFALSASGKLMRGKIGLNHLMRKKDGSRRRNLLAGDSLYKGDRKRISRMLGESI